MDSKPSSGRAGKYISWFLCAALVVVAFEPGRGVEARTFADVMASARSMWIRTVDWERIRGAASVLHGTAATTAIVMFTDYECPFCRTADAALDTLHSIRPSLGVAIRHVIRNGSERGRMLALTALCADRRAPGAECPSLRLGWRPGGGVPSSTGGGCQGGAGGIGSERAAVPGRPTTASVGASWTYPVLADG